MISSSLSSFYLDCFIMYSTADDTTAASVVSLDHSSQNLTVELLGSGFGFFIIILLGNKQASPTTKASPTSRIGSISPKFPMLSGRSLFITFWSQKYQIFYKVQQKHAKFYIRITKKYHRHQILYIQKNIRCSPFGPHLIYIIVK